MARSHCIALLLAVTAALVLAGPAAAWVAYNDCVYLSPPSNPNVTTVNIGTDSPGPSSGVLKDFATGASTGVTATLTQNGGVMYQSSVATGGADAAPGTDAYSVFNPSTASLAGVTYYAPAAGWYVDLTFTGLNPNLRYEFVTSANRNDAAYTDRVTRFHIDGIDYQDNTSTPGVTITSLGTTVRFNTGYNTTTGYVARWTNIAPGADGSFTVRAEAGTTTQNKAYAFSAFRLAVVPEPSSFTVLALGIIPFLRRKRS